MLSWEKEPIEINGVQVFLPPPEDTIVLKLLSPRRKDAGDDGVALGQRKEKISLETWFMKSSEVGKTFRESMS